MTLAEATRQYQVSLEAVREDPWNDDLKLNLWDATLEMERLWVIYEAERICA